jgi:hypothetical protein
MPPPEQPSELRPPHIVATGFTTAFLGDERTLREFVAGDQVVQALRSRGEPAVLYLVNDSYDPLTERQLRIGVSKNAARIEELRPFYGRPIGEVPDPFGCHASYSSHFAELLTARLRDLDIHPLVLDTYEAYAGGRYAPFVALVFERYHAIQEELERSFGYRPRSLFRPQCARCHTIDATHITGVDGPVHYRCERCSADFSAEAGELRGKLNWKLDCAARWNLYQIGTEVFSKAHMAELGTFNIACHVSRKWFGTHVPTAVEYGHLRLDPELSGKLLEVLPPDGLKRLLFESLARDITVTRSALERFAQSYEVRPGTSYAHFVREELPHLALEVACRDWSAAGSIEPAEQRIGPRALLAHASAYSELVHGRRYSLRPPEAMQLEDEDPTDVGFARDAIAIALAVRREKHAGERQLKALLKLELEARPMPGVYRFLRRVLGQEHGPNITTLLAVLPLDYLAVVHVLLDAFASASAAQVASPVRGAPLALPASPAGHPSTAPTPTRDSHETA